MSAAAAAIAAAAVGAAAVGAAAELEPALKLLGKIEEKFVAVSDMMECTDDGRDSNIFVSKSFDATSHFESATQDVLKM